MGRRNASSLNSYCNSNGWLCPEFFFFFFFSELPRTFASKPELAILTLCDFVVPLCLLLFLTCTKITCVMFCADLNILSGIRKVIFIIAGQQFWCNLLKSQSFDNWH
uniref:Uncharacterized protein n=1 Tax=Anguilla anguilla TaxID=7936 RepID=A0A0E9X2Y5_ANGAN